jgi:hypothetical protein
MRFMIIVKASPESEAGMLPEERVFAAMAAYHEELARAGVLLDANGLQPTSKGFRVRHGADGKRTIVDGPFAETKELVAGYTLIHAKSAAEAVEWARRMPGDGRPGEIEVRQLYELEDFGPGDAIARLRGAGVAQK